MPRALTDEEKRERAKSSLQQAREVARKEKARVRSKERYARQKREREAERSAGAPASRQRANIQGNERSARTPDRSLAGGIGRDDGRIQGSGIGVPGRGEFDPGADEREREDTAAIADGYQRATARNNGAASLTSRLATSLNNLGNRALDGIVSLGQSRERDEDDEDNEADEDGGARERMRAAFEAWRDTHGGVFSEEEAAERREDLILKLVDYSGYLDTFLTLSNGMHAECDIWQLDQKEAKPLANIWLARARRNETAAVSLRAFLDGDDYLQAAIVLGPRVLRTASWYPRHKGFNLERWREEGPS